MQPVIRLPESRPGELRPAPQESVRDNGFWPLAKPSLSVVIPTYRYDCCWLIKELATRAGAEAIEIVIYDDGGEDPAFLERLCLAADRSPVAVRVVSNTANLGRSAARNRAFLYARADWLLLLDADMAPDYHDFITNYLGAIEQATGPELVVGGHSLRQASAADRFSLHIWQTLRSECLPAHARNDAPGRYVFSSNVLAHRDVLAECPFDETFAGWGWEDTDWGLRVEAHFPIIHIDNNASHLGLDEDKALMEKYERSGPNFAKLVQRHPKRIGETALFRAVRVARRLPFRPTLKALLSRIALSTRLPVRLRGRALKAWRALVYAEAF